MNGRSADFLETRSRHETLGKSAEFNVTILPRVRCGSIIIQRRASETSNSAISNEETAMRKLVLALGLIFTTAMLGGTASAFPGANGLLDALANQNLVQDVQYCRRGNYWCPGRISGCCPVGWACGSTTCYRSKTRSSPAARSNKIPAR
jgi:hypothetical protein